MLPLMTFVTLQYYENAIDRTEWNPNNQIILLLELKNHNFVFSEMVYSLLNCK